MHDQEVFRDLDQEAAAAPSSRCYYSFSAFGTDRLGPRRQSCFGVAYVQSDDVDIQPTRRSSPGTPRARARSRSAVREKPGLPEQDRRPSDLALPGSSVGPTMLQRTTQTLMLLCAEVRSSKEFLPYQTGPLYPDKILLQNVHFVGP